MNNKNKQFGGLFSLILSVVIAFGLYASSNNTGIKPVEDFKSNVFHKVEKSKEENPQKPSTPSSDNSSVEEKLKGDQNLELVDTWNGKNSDLIKEVNSGKAEFTDKELKENFIRSEGDGNSLNVVDGLQFSPLDDKGRTHQVNAKVTPKTLKGSIPRPPIPSSSAPSGWTIGASFNSDKQQWLGGTKINKVTLSTSSVKKSVPFNQGHLVGWQLFDNPEVGPVGKLMDVQNLVVETRYANAPVQLKYENQIAKAAKNGSEVRLQVTPLYFNDELIPRAIHYMAKSTDGKLEINILIINSQEDLNVDYKDGSKSSFK